VWRWCRHKVQAYGHCCGCAHAHDLSRETKHVGVVLRLRTRRRDGGAHACPDSTSHDEATKGLLRMDAQFNGHVLLESVTINARRKHLPLNVVWDCKNVNDGTAVLLAVEAELFHASVGRKKKLKLSLPSFSIQSHPCRSGACQINQPFIRSWVPKVRTHHITLGGRTGVVEN
jgi:hypothetical protein